MPEEGIESPVEVYRGCMCDAHMADLPPEVAAEAREFAERARRLERRRSLDQQRRRERRREEERAERERHLDEVLTCNTCDNERQRREMLDINGVEHCHDCAAECSRCSNTALQGDMATVSRDWREVLVCRNCMRTCAECDGSFYVGDMIMVHGAWYCRDDVTYCDDCDNYFTGEDCSCESDRVRGLTGYGKTHPERWLGGPVPKDKKGFDLGYYIGFELEIYAQGGHVRPIHEWAADNLGYSDALDCKEDSSVEGFEIATQPMTPEFFEKVDWESFFEVINQKFPLDNNNGQEWIEHGLHVHIGRAAFARDDIAMAAYCYLLGQGNHLVRIGRREPTTYCKKVDKPVSTVIKRANNESGKHHKQASKPQMRSLYPGRDAVNLTNGSTIEIRAFRSTRKADELRDAVRLVYVGAEYIRHLRSRGGNVSPRALHWGEFAKWVGVHYPQAFESIAGITDKKVVR